MVSSQKVRPELPLSAASFFVLLLLRSCEVPRQLPIHRKSQITKEVAGRARPGRAGLSGRNCPLSSPQ